MQMEEKLEKISERLEVLEHEYHSDKKVVKACAALFAVLLVAFFSISLGQIRSKVNEAMSANAITRSKEAAANALKAIDNSKTKAEAVLRDVNDLITDAKKALQDVNAPIVDIYQYRAERPYRIFCDVNDPRPGFKRDPSPVFRAFSAKKSE